MSPQPQQAQQQSPQQTTVYISFVAEINVSTAEVLLNTCGQLANQKIKNVHLLLSTPGGQVREGIALYNTLRAMPFKLITHNTGSVNSIGNVIFLAGEERYACPVSYFMFHGVGFEAPGVRLEEKLLRERLDGIMSDQGLIAKVIQERTRLNSEETSKLFLQAVTKDAPWAKDVGIIDEIREAHIPSGTPVVQLVFQR